MRLWCIAVNAAIDKTYVVPGFRASAEYRLGRAVAVPRAPAVAVPA